MQIHNPLAGIYTCFCLDENDSVFVVWQFSFIHMFEDVLHR